MDKRVGSNLIVGGFVVLGLVLFVFLLFNMGGGQGVFSSRYTLYGKFSHVKGLHYGSEVTLNGLRIGTVKEINIGPDGKELVAQISINRQYSNKIRKDSIAKVVTQGMLGDKFIDISLGSDATEELKEGDYLDTQEEKDILSKSGGLIEEISKKFDRNGDIDEILKNLSAATANIKQITADATKGKGLLAEVTKGESGNKLNRAMGHLESILKKVDNGDGTLGALMNDPTVYEDIKTILGGAKRSSILKYFVGQFKDSGQEEPKKKK